MFCLMAFSKSSENYNNFHKTLLFIMNINYNIMLFVLLYFLYLYHTTKQYELLRKNRSYWGE